MFSQNNQSRFSATKKKKKQQQQNQQQHQSSSRLSLLRNHLFDCFKSILSNNLIATLFGPIVLFYCISSMSMFYQVMGAIKCRKIKKHSGIKLRPINKSKEPFMPDDMLLFTCESTEYTQTIRCQEDGSWSDLPTCPDPANFTCPDLEPLLHGTFTPSTASPYKVGTMVLFQCDNEVLPNLNQSSSGVSGGGGGGGSSSYSNHQLASTTTVSGIQSTTAFPSLQGNNHTTTISENITAMNAQAALRYNLTGHRVLKCMPSAKWDHPVPTCTPFYPDQPSNVGFLFASTILILIPVLILIVLFHLFVRWRKRQQQRERWKQYFTDYKYRHSKTSITFANRPTPQTTVPVTDL